MTGWDTGQTILPPSLELGDGVLTTLTCPNLLRQHLQTTGYTSAFFKEQKRLAVTNEGSVKVVLFLSDGKQYALKEYLKDKLSKLRNFQARREIQLHSNFCHPAILPMYAAWEDDHTLCLIMEYLPAGDLYKHLQNRPLHESIAVPRVVAPLLEALEYLHARHVIHRDLKLENVFVTDTAIKVADFGLSINISEERPVTRLGTLPYMSLEILAGVLKSDPRECKERKDLEYDISTDIWAAGVLIFEVLVGSLPFKGQNQAELIASIQKGIVFPHFVTDEAVDFLLCALTLDPLTRPTARQLLRHPWVTRYYTPADTRAAASELVSSGDLRVNSTLFTSRPQASAVVPQASKGSTYMPAPNSGSLNGKGLGTMDSNRGTAVRRVPPPLTPPMQILGGGDAGTSKAEAEPSESRGNKKGFLKVLTGLFIWKRKGGDKIGGGKDRRAKETVARAAGSARSSDPSGAQSQHNLPSPSRPPHNLLVPSHSPETTTAGRGSAGASINPLRLLRASPAVSVSNIDLTGGGGGSAGGRHGSQLKAGTRGGTPPAPSSKPLPAASPVAGDTFVLDAQRRPVPMPATLPHSRSRQPSPTQAFPLAEPSQSKSAHGHVAKVASQDVMTVAMGAVSGASVQADVHPRSPEGEASLSTKAARLVEGRLPESLLGPLGRTQTAHAAIMHEAQERSRGRPSEPSLNF